MADQTVRRGRLTDLVGSSPADQSVGIGTLVDIVFVIDGTGSMQNLLDEVKNRALSMYDDIIAGLKGKNRRVQKMRAKVLVFRDIYVDAAPFEESDFYDLKTEAEDFRAFVESIKARGGGDEPESGLEALYRAIKLKFQERTSNATKARHIILVMTDASAHHLDDPQREGDPEYPKGVPTNLPGLESEWEGMADLDARRLLIMAPNSWPWPAVGAWSQADFKATQAGAGISKEGMDAVIAFISGSM